MMTAATDHPVAAAPFNTLDMPALRERIAASLTSRRARIQLLTGPLGVGKSTLTATVATLLRDNGWTPLPIPGIPGLQGTPHGALGPMLASFAPQAASVEHALHLLFAAAAPARSRQVIVADDASFLDPASAGVIAQLVRIYGLPALVSARSRRVLPESLARLNAEGLVDETPLSWPARFPGEADDRLREAVLRAVDSLDDSERELVGHLAVLGPLPREVASDPTAAESLEDAGLIPQPVDGILRLPHDAFARAVRERMPREAGEDDLAGLLVRLFPDSQALATATQLVGYYRAVELRRPREAVALGERTLAEVPADIGEKLARHVGSWRSMAGVMEARSAEPDTDPLQAAIRGHQRIAAAMVRGDVNAGRAAIVETRRLIGLADGAIETGTLVPDIGEYHLTAVAGDRESADRLEQQILNGDTPPHGLWSASIAYYRMRHTSDLEQVVELARAAFDGLAWHEFFGTRAVAAAVWATAAPQLDRPREARHALRQLSSETQPWSLVDLQASEAEAWLLARSGEPEQAADTLTTALQRAAETGHWGFGTVSAIAGIRFGRPHDMVPFLTSAVEESPIPIAPLALAVAQAAADADAARLATAEQDMRNAGFLPPAVAEVRPGGLTKREWEVASAAGNGESSRSIAERLRLSHRTVETHLHNAYRKLSVSSRTELSEALR